MSTEYTPDWEAVREAASPDGATAIEVDALDRWLAAHDAEVKAAAERERDEALREMHARELHHFEEEQKSARLQAAIREALDVVRSSSVPLGQSEARHWDRLLTESRRILTEALKGQAE